MEKQQHLIDLANASLSHYNECSNMARMYDSTVEKALKFYFCALIFDKLKKNKKNWWDVLCGGDIEFLYKHGTKKQINTADKIIDAYSY